MKRTMWSPALAGLMTAALLTASIDTAAQAPAEPPNPLTSVKRLKCRFPTASAAAWKSGDPQVQIKTQELLFEITAIDVQDGTAEYLGTAGRAYVTAVLSGWSLYFVENAEGQLNVTTDRKSTRLNSSHLVSSYAVFWFKKRIRESVPGG